MNYPFYSNPQFYMQDLQNIKDRIDRTMQQYQQNQMQQPVQQPITQNFQLAPNTINNELESKYAENIEEVKNTFVIKTGVFINKDLSVLWIKDVTGNIRTFRIEEVIEMDEKDKEIFMLKQQIEDMKGMISNANKSVNTIVDDTVAEQKPTRIQNSKRVNAK